MTAHTLCILTGIIMLGLVACDDQRTGSLDSSRDEIADELGPIIQICPTGTYSETSLPDVDTGGCRPCDMAYSTGQSAADGTSCLCADGYNWAENSCQLCDDCEAEPLPPGALSAEAIMRVIHGVLF